MPQRPAQGPRGKLKAVARRWASGRGGKPIAADDALTAAAKLPAWATATRAADEELEVPPDQHPAVILFFALDTQWRNAGMAGARTGIDYAAIEPTARALEIALTPAVMVDLQILEREALATWVEGSR